MSESTTYWVLQLKAGNREAAKQLWERYYRRLVGEARRRLNGRSVAAADENDIAQSAFASFYRAAEQGRFPQLADSGGLWRLLLTIAQRKIQRRLRHDNCRKRRPAAGHAVDAYQTVALEEIAGSDPTPEFCAVAVESFRELLDQLGDGTLRSLALMKMEGYTNEEIAHWLGCSISTVERKLRRIRHEWASANKD